MIFSENFEKTNLSGMTEGVKNYSVITDQLADNLHDLDKLFLKNGYRDSAIKINQAEIEMRKVSGLLSKLFSELAGK